MRVCIVSHSSADGGAERVLLETIDALRDSGIDCLVIFPQQGPLVGQAKERGAECTVLRFSWWAGTRDMRKRLLKVPFNLLAGTRLAIHLATKPCDAVVTNTITVPVGGIAAALLRIPHIWWIHEFGKEDHGFEFDLGMAASTWLIDKTSVMVLVNSRAVASKYASRIAGGKLRLLYYSVEANLTAKRATSCHRGPTGNRPQPVICVVGRIEPGKNQEDAIRALARLKATGTHAKLVLVGSTRNTDYYERLKVLRDQFGLGGSVEFMGHLTNPLPEIRSSDVVAVCSRSEAFGRVTVEAMKLGKPVVGARSGGTAELIEDGVTGFLYTPSDDADLALKLRRLLADATLRMEVGKRARTWASCRFTRERFRDDLMSLLIPLLPAPAQHDAIGALREADQ